MRSRWCRCGRPNSRDPAVPPRVVGGPCGAASLSRPPSQLPIRLSRDRCAEVPARVDLAKSLGDAGVSLAQYRYPIDEMPAFAAAVYGESSTAAWNADRGGGADTEAVTKAAAPGLRELAWSGEPAGKRLQRNRHSPPTRPTNPWQQKTTGGPTASHGETPACARRRSCWARLLWWAWWCWSARWSRRITAHQLRNRPPRLLLSLRWCLSR